MNPFFSYLFTRTNLCTENHSMMILFNLCRNLMINRWWAGGGEHVAWLCWLERKTSCQTQTWRHACCLLRFGYLSLSLSYTHRNTVKRDGNSLMISQPTNCFLAVVKLFLLLNPKIYRKLWFFFLWHVFFYCIINHLITACIFHFMNKKCGQLWRCWKIWRFWRMRATWCCTLRNTCILRRLDRQTPLRILWERRFCWRCLAASCQMPSSPHTKYFQSVHSSNFW